MTMTTPQEVRAVAMAMRSHGTPSSPVFDDHIADMLEELACLKEVTEDKVIKACGVYSLALTRTGKALFRSPHEIAMRAAIVAYLGGE